MEEKKSRREVPEIILEEIIWQNEILLKKLGEVTIECFKGFEREYQLWKYLNKRKARFTSLDKYIINRMRDFDR